MLEDFWRSASPATERFDASRVASIPEPARCYLEHAIAPGTLLASAVRLRMRGEIRIGRWLPFHAEQVIHAERGFIWRAAVPRFGIPLIRGFDRLVDGAGAMRWRLFGLFPVMVASGPDITRAAVGRVNAESIWLPSVPVRDDVRWTARDNRKAAATFRHDSEPVEFEIDGRGRAQSVRMRRWSNPGGGAFRLVDFGGVLEAVATFGGYTIPSRVRVGWFIGTPRFEAEGEFFRAAIEDAAFR
jgi:hypothetical protein